MTREQAVQKMRRLLGKDARYRVAKGLTSPEKRAAAQAELLAVRDERERCPYVEVDRYNALSARERALFRAAHEYRFKILRNDGWTNFVVGKGDTWEDAFASMADSPFMRRKVARRAS